MEFTPPKYLGGTFMLICLFPNSMEKQCDQVKVGTLLQMEVQFSLFNYMCTLFLIPKPFKYYFTATRYSFDLGIITKQFIIFRQDYLKIIY